MELVLVIDDNPAVRTMLTEALQMAGYQVVEAEGVQSGIAQALKAGPAMILCDVKLKDGNGFAILEAMQQHPRMQRVPFIFVSGEAVSPAEIRKGMEMGADDYLLKPVSIPVLLAAVQARFQRARQLAGQTLRLPTHSATSYESLQYLLEQLNRQNITFCLFEIGFHHFERFVRLFGWKKSDQLIQILIERLLRQFKGISPVAYLSHEPDKFYLLWQDQIQPEAARHIAQRILKNLAQPLNTEEHVLRLSSYVGLMIGSSAVATAQTAMALHRAATLGPGSIAIYEAGMEQEIRHDFKWEVELGLALEQNRFELYYQPQFALKSLRLCGVEALIRLRHPELGLIQPSTFIPIAEDCGLMDQIGEWVLTTACQQVSKWGREAGLFLKLAVNVSQIQFQNRDFAGLVARILTETGLKAQALELELTESMLMQDPVQTFEQLKALKALGVTLAMDDFGTGYSSMKALRQMPFDLLKIDLSFVRGLDALASSRAIPRAITDMGHSLGMKVLAEGIEDEAQLQLLRQMGCDFGQGFWFSRPLSAEQLPVFWKEKALLLKI